MINHPGFALALRLIAAAMSFAFGILAARVLGVEGFGAFNMVLAFVNIGIVVSLLGHETLATRDVARSLGSPEGHADLKRYILQTARWVLLASIFVMLAELLMLWALPQGGRVPIEMWFMLALVVLIARTRFSQAIIRGAHKASLALVPDGILRPGLAMLGFAAMLAVGISSVSVIVVLMLGSALLAMLAGMYWEKKSLGSDKRVGSSAPPPEVAMPSKRPAFSGAMYASSILAVLGSQMAIIATSAIAGPEQAGLYAAAERFALAAALIGQAVYQAVASRLAALYAKGEHEAMRVLVRRVTRRVALGTLAVVAVIMFAARPLLMLYGPGFEAAQPVLMVLLVSVLINVSVGPVGMLLLMTHNERYHFAALIASVLTQMALFPWVISHYGVVGAAAVVLISTIVWNALMSNFVHRRLAINQCLIFA